ncbi:MAG TPA: hypothetical protein VGR78_10345 [Verrucomicrobiae bacterium]|nr:hypothetical protein [Verrucomicrobiae bacterium]
MGMIGEMESLVTLWRDKANWSPLLLKLPEELPMEEWANIGRELCRTDQVMKWWIGDWAAFGLRKYGQLKEFAEMNGLNYQSLANMAWVSKSVEVSRRRESLEWSKHQEVAALPAKEQEKWLARAEKEELPVAEMRRQIRQSQGENNALQSDGPVIKFASKACDDLVNWIKSQPEDFWNEERRAAWRARLRPIVEFYQEL